MSDMSGPCSVNTDTCRFPLSHLCPCVAMSMARRTGTGDPPSVTLRTSMDFLSGLRLPWRLSIGESTRFLGGSAERGEAAGHRRSSGGNTIGKNQRMKKMLLLLQINSMLQLEGDINNILTNIIYQCDIKRSAVSSSALQRLILLTAASTRDSLANISHKSAGANCLIWLAGLLASEN